MSEEFYVGYVPKAPPSLAKIIARIATGLLLAGLVVAATLIFDQPPFAASRFEYGEYRDYSGVIEEWPYPLLITSDSSYLLVAPGKHGLSESVRGMEGKSVRLKGALIVRGADRMLEVLPGSISNATASIGRVTNQRIELGSVTLRGEIVDSKCYLGVMNPGSGKVHRDCAVRCISGGAPPALIVRDADGDSRVLLLIGTDDRALNREVLPFVAEPLEISGRLVRSGATLILRSEPGHFRRLSGIE